MSSQRLQKVLAQAGIASRRAAEHLITEGRVRVNGRIVTELGARANPDKDRVEVDGRRLVAQRHVYFLMHKPRGVVTTLDDPEGRKTVKDLLRNINERVFPVGRLDFQTSGALLLTNDGDLAQALLHPTRAVPKTYNAKLEGELDEARLEQLRTGVVLDDGKKTAPAEVSILRKDDKSTSVEITIAEGKNRQIHRMGEAIHRTVMRLTRISFAGLTLEGLRAGQMRQLTPVEVTELKQTYLHKPKRRRPFKAYGEMDLDEAGPLFAIDSEGEEEEPVRAPADRDGAARVERSSRFRRGADNERTSHDARDGFAKRDPRDARGKRDPRDGFAKRDPRGKRDTQDGFTERDPRDARAMQDPRGRRDPRDGFAKRDPREGRGKRDPRDGFAKRESRGKRDLQDGFAKGDPRSGRGKRDPRYSFAKGEPREARGKRDLQDGFTTKRDPRDARGKRDLQDGFAKRDARAVQDPRGKRDPRAKFDPRTRRDPRIDRDQVEATELEPRKTQRGARTQPAKRTRSHASTTKRGPAPRKTRFKR